MSTVGNSSRMRRRTFLAGAGVVAGASFAGCFDATGEGSPNYAQDDHASHTDELRSEIERRGVDVETVEHDDPVATVKYESESANDDLAEVAMAFVERVQGGWGVDRLEAVGRGEAAMSWHAETEWAEQYLDEEIDAEEYGAKINDTVEHMLLGGDDDSLDGVGSDGD